MNYKEKIKFLIPRAILLIIFSIIAVILRKNLQGEFMDNNGVHFMMPTVFNDEDSIDIDLRHHFTMAEALFKKRKSN